MRTSTLIDFIASVLNVMGQVLEDWLIPVDTVAIKIFVAELCEEPLKLERFFRKEGLEKQD